MRVEQIKLRNFRGISEMCLDFDDSLNVFSGVNGSGKSSILDALAIMLSWMTSRIRRTNALGKTVDELSIKNGTSFSTLEIYGSFQGKSAGWVLSKTKKGRRKRGITSDYSLLNDIVVDIQQRIEETEEHCSIPLLVYYPVNRVVTKIPLRIRNQHAFNLLDAYDHSLTSGANFRTFFEWFRNREDLENESRKYSKGFGLFKPDNWEFPDRQLEAVRCALSSFLPDFSNISVRRNPLRMVVYKSGQELWVNQLSDGEKCLIALIGDLARRLAIANPILRNPLEGSGVVLIDEIDLHLHPRWQRMLIPRLIKTFPNCQFFISTHSPQVLGEIDPQHIWFLHQDEQTLEIDYSKPSQAFGLSSGEILEESMDANRRNLEVDQRINKIFSLIDGEKFTTAKRDINALKKIVHGNIPDLVKAEAMIEMFDPDGGKGQ